MLSSARLARRAVSGARHRARRSTGARRYLPPGRSLEAFFDELNARGVTYAVLRWFEDLPHVEAGEDVDMLVADEDLALVHSLMAIRPPLRASQKFDVYSVSGLPGSDFAGVPYYAPRFASELLDTAVWHRDRYRVPDPVHHADSLAYHAVYHKGWASGLADGIEADRPRSPSDHDYEATLAALGAAVGEPVTPTLDAYDLRLDAKGLRPPLDTLERLAPCNPWLERRFLVDAPEIDDLWAGVAVFVVRERAEAHVQEVVKELDRQGFEVLDVLELDLDQREAVAHRLRGGNWARGPWQVSGGEPATYVVAYDVAPQTLDGRGARAANLRIPVAKQRVRDRLMAGVPSAERYNPVHSSDNPGQALDYLDAVGDPELASRVHGLATKLLESCTFPYPVVRDLSAEARRARVAVVDHPVHGECVCKVFRPGAARFFEREVLARTELSEVPEVPDLLERGDGWLVMPLHRDDGAHFRKVLPGGLDFRLQDWVIRDLLRFAGDLHDRGLFMLDLSTQNLMHDPEHGLKVIDFEFLQAYDGPAPSAAESWTLHGVPAGRVGYDLPQPTRLTRGRANPAFHPAITGAPVGSLAAWLDRPTTGTAARRSLVRGRWDVEMAYRQGVERLRDAVKASRWEPEARAMVTTVRRLRRA